MEKFWNWKKSSNKPEQLDKDEVDSSRRAFLRGAGAVAAAAVVSTPVSEALAQLAEAPSKKFESIPAEALKPEYERLMKEIFLVFDDTPDIGSDLDEILTTVPSYTRIRAIIRSGKTDEFDAYLEKRGIRNEILYSGGNFSEREARDRWAQDFGSGVNLGDDRQTIVVPSTRRWTDKADVPESNSGRTKRLEPFAGDSEGPLNIIKAPFMFDGGNVFFDKDEQGRARVLAGFSTFMSHDEYRYTTPEEVKKLVAQRKEIVSQFFGGAEVLVMGEAPQKSSAFHLDQSFAILPGMHTVLTGCEKPEGYDERNPEGVAPDGLDLLYKQQQAMQQQLEAAGYTVHVLPQSHDDSIHHRFSVNGTIYTDAETGKLTFIQPVFDGQYNDAETHGRPLVPEDISGTAKAAHDLFTALGCDVKLARNSAIGNGNIHCMLNQLASVKGDAAMLSNYA